MEDADKNIRDPKLARNTIGRDEDIMRAPFPKGCEVEITDRNDFLGEGFSCTLESNERVPIVK